MIQTYFTQIKRVIDQYAPTSFVLEAQMNLDMRPGDQGYLTGTLIFADDSKLEGFTYAPSEDVFWMHGHSTEQDFLYVTTQFMSKEMLTRISDEVGPNRSLLIYCTAFRCAPSQFPNLTLKKIPNAVLTRCEWGKDNYSLAVANLPPRPVEPGTQPSLFEEAQL